MPKYTVLSAIWSRPHRQYFYPGEVVDFPDNPVPDPETGVYPEGEAAIVVDFDLLVSKGVLEPYTEPMKTGKKKTQDESPVDTTLEQEK